MFLLHLNSGELVGLRDALRQCLQPAGTACDIAW